MKYYAVKQKDGEVLFTANTVASGNISVHSFQTLDEVERVEITGQEYKDKIVPDQLTSTLKTPTA